MALSIDHLVLPVGNLGLARTRLSALGFHVAPDAVHPFGTANCCVYLADGTYLEPLAIHDPAHYAAAIAAGNVFVARDRAYRAVHGTDGFSALAFGTEDAEAEHRRFERSGVSAGPMLEFERPFADGSGLTGTAGFRLAFAAPPGSRDTFFFAVQRVNVPAVGRAALEHHTNGVRGLTKVHLVAGRPADFVSFFEAMAEVDVVALDDAVNFDLGGVLLSIGPAASPEATLSLDGLTFGVADLAALADVLDRGKIVRQGAGPSIRVPPAAGQGAEFTFEDGR